MKVMQVLPELNSGGVERGTLELGAFLAREGHDSLVVSHGGTMVAELQRDGSRHIAMPVHRKSPLSLLQIGKMRRLLIDERPDILHLRSRVPAWIAWLAWRKLPVGSRPRLVTTVHGFNSVNRYSRIMTCGERVIAVSRSVATYVRENYPDVSEDRIRVVNRGVDPTVYPYGFQPSSEWLNRWRNEYPILRDKLLLTLPGRITRLKGHEDFFKVVAALRQQGLPIHGLIVGGVHPKKREYGEDLKRLVQNLELGDHITFTGARNDLREILSLSHVVFSLTQQPESFGRTTLEALSLGRPVIGYDHGGVGEQLHALFPPGAIPVGDYPQATALIARWGDQPPAPKRDHTYTLEAMLRGTVAVYGELLAGPR
jgi:glycosyltransferase involved in cell wall biosynthesis